MEEVSSLTVYDRLEELVLPHLSSFKDDLQKHDRNTLEGYTGAFVYGYRPLGTHILLLPQSVKEAFKERFVNEIAAMDLHQGVEHLRETWSANSVYLGPASQNKWFLHYDGKRFHKKTQVQAIGIFLAHVDIICDRVLEMNYGQPRIVKLP